MEIFKRNLNIPKTCKVILILPYFLHGNNIILLLFYYLNQIRYSIKSFVDILKFL